MKNIVLAAVVTAIAGGAYANPIGPYDELLVFGDSLSDPGNAYAAFGEAAAPSGFYPENQFTNDNVWATYLQEQGASVTNYAFGGAKAVTDDDGAKDFAAQRGDYFNEVANGLDLGDNVMTAVFFGGNDLRTASTPDEAALAIGGAMQALGQGIGELAASGLTDFMVFGLPNLGRLPAVVATETPLDDLAGTGASIGFNEALNGVIDSLSGLANIQFFDTFAFLEEQMALAEAAGVNTRQSCQDFAPACNPATVGDFEVTSEAFGTTNGFVFYDALHPTDTVHRALAEAVTDQLAAVPLPAGAPLLLVALGGLGVASRRRVAGRSD